MAGRNTERLFFSDVRYLVMDEADVLVGEDFAPSVNKIVPPLRVRLAPVLQPSRERDVRRGEMLSD